MYSCCQLFSASVLLATCVFSASGIPFSQDETFGGIKLYNSLEQALFSKYARGPNGNIPKTEPNPYILGDHEGGSILDDYHQNVSPPKNNHYTLADHEAFIKIANTLYKRPVSEKYGEGVNDEYSKKLLNGVLVAQLQSLFDSNRFLAMNDKGSDNGMYNIPGQMPTAPPAFPITVPTETPAAVPLMIPVGQPIHKASATPIELANLAKTPSGQPKEHLFLVLNEELKTTTNEELIYVDPNSLGEDSTVFVLGGLNDLYSNKELAALMNSVQTELLKPKYLPLLYTLSSSSKQPALNAELGANIYSGASARRYVKAHRCNYQSPLAKIKNGGSNWVICTGYLNINTPSFYDK